MYPLSTLYILSFSTKNQSRFVPQRIMRKITSWTNIFSNMCKYVMIPVELISSYKFANATPRNKW